jgi:hypothetical protein
MLSTFAYEAAGALGTRHSLRPLLLGERFFAGLGRIALRDGEVVSAVWQLNPKSGNQARRALVVFSSVPRMCPSADSIQPTIHRGHVIGWSYQNRRRMRR